MAKTKEAKAAYLAAVELIERAQKDRRNWLRLSGAKFFALDELPPEIADLTQLRKLSLWETKVIDLATLAPLTGLTELDLSGTEVSNLGPIATMTSLRELKLAHTSIINIAPLASLTELTALDLAGTQVIDFVPLASLTGLKKLGLAQTSISNLAPIGALTELTEIDLSGTQVSDLAPLSSMTDMMHLRLHGTPIRQIENIAHMTKLRRLVLSETQVIDLAPLSRLTSLRYLNLKNTQISDVSTLSNLTELRNLILDGTNTSDLRPLSGLQQLGSEPYSELSFKRTPWAMQSARMNELSYSSHYRKRTREVLNYIETLPLWPKPLPWLKDEYKAESPTPEQDPALPLIWGENGFAFLASRIDADPVTEAALEDLHTMLQDLRRKGNRHDDLYRLAGEVQDRAKGEVRDLNMVRLHLSYQKLRRLYQSRVSRAEAFDDETVGVLGSVLEILPGVTMADPQVEILIKRQEADLRAGAVADTVKAEEAVLAAMQSDDAPFAPEVKEAAKDIAEPGQDDRLSATRGILSRNGLIAVFKYVAGAAAAGAISGPVGNFLYEHGTQYLALAQTLGADAYFWAQMVFTSFQAEYQIAMGIAKEVIGSGKVASPKRPKPKDQ